MQLSKSNTNQPFFTLFKKLCSQLAATLVFGSIYDSFVLTETLGLDFEAFYAFIVV